MLNPGSGKEVVQLEGIKVIKLDSGYITYQPLERQQRQLRPRYNTLRTPRGGQYRLQLPDGTKVWLNAASSIRYPIAFSENERRVEITGEVYLEVANDVANPFVVDISSADHTSELQSLMRISYAVFCLKKINILTVTTMIAHTPA